ncbi:hypothetical protein DL771_010213 [Monosporascus sp. 5C6A]|nr:hypothetical protein DL771_010213 [Monosporascus sp. 5C6A]
MSLKATNTLVSIAQGNRGLGPTTMEQSSVVTHYALLIGICFTPKERRHEWPPLRGCIQDVQEIKDHLAKLSPGAHIRTFTASLSEPDASCPAEEEEDLPTHKNVMESLENITLRASAGSFIYIHFTGHGTAIKPTSCFANSSTGESALVVLASDDKTKIQYLHGSELAGSLKRMVEKGLKVTLVLDCCASGSVVRDKVDPSVRFLPYDSAVDTAHSPVPGQSISPEDEATSPAIRGSSMRANWLVDPDGYTVLTACGPTEMAREVFDKDGLWHGLLSYFLVRTFVKRGRVGGKLQHIYAHLCARFREKSIPQTPMLYGNKDLYFFEDANPGDDVTLIPIITNLDRSLQLGAGEAHGVCKGDRFALCPLGHKNRDSGSEQVAIHFEVTRAGALISDLQASDSIPMQSGMTVRACTRLALRRFPVLLDLRLQCRTAWEIASRKRPSLDVQYAKNVNAGTSFSFRVIILAKDSYKIRDDSDQEIPDLPPPPPDLDVNADYVLDIVEHLANRSASISSVQPER